MSDDLWKWIGGIAFSMIAFFFVRWLKKERESERLARTKAKLEIAEKCRSLGVNPVEAEAVLRSLGLSNGEGSSKAIMSIDDEIEKEEFAAIDEATCQQDMNAAAEQRFNRLDKKLGDSVMLLKRKMKASEFDAKPFDATHSAWKTYRQRVAEEAAAPWTGGSMTRFIVAGAKSRITKQRIAEIEEKLTEFEMADLNRLRNKM